jgi:hypothetical protein
MKSNKFNINDYLYVFWPLLANITRRNKHYEDMYDEQRLIKRFLPLLIKPSRPVTGIFYLYLVYINIMFLDIINYPVFIWNSAFRRLETGPSSIDWSQLIRFYLQTKSTKRCLLKFKRDSALDKNRTMGHAQKYIISSNIPMRQTFSSS